MKICLGFFGFIRSFITKSDFEYFKKILPSNSIIDIIVSCPDKLGEFDTESSSETIYKTLNEIFIGHTIEIYLYSYNPSKFVEKQEELKLPFFSSETQFYSYRILSLQNSISELCKKIKNYDISIITRFDLFSTIRTLGNVNFNNIQKTIYIWRTTPYESEEDAEDRIIISSQDGIDKLSYLYDSAHEHLEIYSVLTSEKILGKYLNSFTDLIKEKQSGIEIGLSRFLSEKYGNSFRKKCDQFKK
jgi:hypothetical protein